MTPETSDKLIVEVGGYQQRAYISNSGLRKNYTEMQSVTTKQESEIFLSRGRMYYGVSVIHCLPKAPKHRQTQSEADKRIRIR